MTFTAADAEGVLDGSRSTTLARDVIDADGPDTVKFLHSQLSQDLLSMVSGDVRWAFLLQPTGKLVGLVRVVRGEGDAVTLDTDAGHGQTVLDALSRFKIRTKCELHLRADESFAARWTGRVPELQSDAADLDADASTFGAIVRGFPRWGSEMDDATIPNATGVVAQAVSFTKGCYTGQELVERIDSRGGNVPRHLVGLRIGEGAAAPVGAELLLDGAVVGVVTSATADPRGTDVVALGYVKRDVADDVTLHLDDGAVVTIRSLD